MDSFLSSSWGTTLATAVSQEVITSSLGTAHQLVEAVQNSVQWCPRQRKQGWEEEQGGKENSLWTREQQHECWVAGPVQYISLSAKPWHKRQQAETVPPPHPPAVCRCSPARCQAVMHGWLWRTSKLAWRRRQESDEMGMSVYWEGERGLVFPLPASPH